MPSGWRDQYNRMKRWSARLTDNSFEPRDVDDFYAFFSCCFHLKDWLKADPAVDPALGAEAERYVQNHVVALRLCADLANGSKHFIIDKYVRHSADARVERLIADSDLPVDDLPPDANDMIIVFANGVAWPAFWVAKRCVEAWERFLQKKGLLNTAR